MNLRIPQGKGSSPVVTLTHWIRQQWAVAQWLGPRREEAQVRASNAHRQDGRQCGQGHRCWAARLSLPQPENHRPDPCPSQLQMLSLYDCHGGNELQTDMVLKNGFGEQLTAHRLGRALSTLLPEIYWIRVAQRPSHWELSALLLNFCRYYISGQFLQGLPNVQCTGWQDRLSL